MKTEFLALWVDDNRPFVESLEVELRDWLDEKGFDLRTFAHKDKTRVLDDVIANDLELIIIDYKLPKGNGDVIIEEIRDMGCYQDIIFYSEGDLPNRRFDGVFYVSKQDAKDRIKEIIELKLRRSSDLATLRGWVVADAIELEQMIEELLVKWFAPKHVVFETQVMRKIGVFDFNKKQMTLNSIISEELRIIQESNDDAIRKSERGKKLSECKKTLSAFEEDVVHYRNAVAHSKVEVKDGKKRLKSLIGKDKYFEFDEDKLIDARKKFRAQRDCLLALFDIL